MAGWPCSGAPLDAVSPPPLRRLYPRLISAAPFRDRVVHHALCAAIVPPLERAFHPGSHANRRGYGSHRALRRFTAAAARHRWVLQADIRLYFPSIDLTIVRRQLSETIACPGTLWLLDQILTNGATLGPALEVFPGDTLLTPQSHQPVPLNVRTAGRDSNGRRRKGPDPLQRSAGSAR